MSHTSKEPPLPCPYEKCSVNVIPGQCQGLGTCPGMESAMAFGQHLGLTCLPAPSCLRTKSP